MYLLTYLLSSFYNLKKVYRSMKGDAISIEKVLMKEGAPFFI